MSSNVFQNLRDLSPASFNWNIKVRIIRSWRGVSSSGEPFKGLNLLLLDNKNDRMHAFAPGNVIDKHEEKFTVGNICTIANFIVKEYKTDEKFRCINRSTQIILTEYTDVTKKKHEDKLIAQNMFDFYDLSGLNDLANKNVFLTDVLGVIEKDLPLSNLVNRFGRQQKQLKFNIVDGRTSANVTLWDALAEDIQSALEDLEEYPPIVIIASAKITSWKGTGQKEPQIEICNTTATKIYFNHDHPNVHQLRKMITTPRFRKYDFSAWSIKTLPDLSVKDIQDLDMKHVNREVRCSVFVKKIYNDLKWYYYECSSCYKEIEFRENILRCYRCANRYVPHPYKRWRLYIKVGDSSREMDVILFDREVRTILGKEASEFGDEVPDNNGCPSFVKRLLKQEFTMSIQPREENIGNKEASYFVTGIYQTKIPEQNSNTEQSPQTQNMQESLTQASQSDCHLEDFENLTFRSEETTKKTQRRKLKGKNIIPN
ncbi:hypothetical protein ACET3Z_010789 [Daucus carota]